jgi:uncharacterized protein
LISSAGVIIAVLVAVRIPKQILSLYIGILVVAMGVLVLATAKRPLKFSWRRLLGVSFIASFNKGISGGGYGPLVMGGQMLSGVNVKSAIGITAFAEAVTCLVGFVVYLVKGRVLDWTLILLLVVSATGAVPLAAFTVKNTRSVRLKIYVGILMTALGFFTLFKISSGG